MILCLVKEKNTAQLYQTMVDIEGTFTIYFHS
jgi:hypothetical protein